MSFPALVAAAQPSASVNEFGQGSIAERDADPTARLWVVDSTDPDPLEHDKTYVLKEGGWVEITESDVMHDAAGIF